MSRSISVATKRPSSRSSGAPKRVIASPAAFAVHSVFGLRPALLAMT
jgi:hypothetical protein